MAINTNSITAYGITTSFSLTSVETVDIATNTSSIEFTLTTVQSPKGSGYQRSIYSGSTVTINGTAYVVSTAKVSHGDVAWTKTIKIPHNADGSKTIACSIRINLGGDILTGSGNIALTNIPRGSQIVLSSSSLEDGKDDLIIDVVAHISTYSHQLKCFLNDELKHTVNLAAGTYRSTYFTNAVLSSYLGDAYSGMATFRFELITLNGAEQVGETSVAELLFRKGFIPLSIWQDGNDVGVCFGKEASRPGIDFSGLVSVGKFETLWTQSATSMGATTIDVDLSKYEAVVLVTTTGTYYNFALTVRIHRQWQGDTHKTKVTEQQAGRMVARYFSFFDDHIVVGAGYRTGTYGNSSTTTDNAQVVPVAIIGIR